jgi:hypothetical protein
MNEEGKLFPTFNRGSKPGANPMIVGYNASFVVKILRHNE